MKVVAIAIAAYLIAAILMDIAYAIETKGLPWYHWLRMVDSGLTIASFAIFAAYVWPAVTK